MWPKEWEYDPNTQTLRIVAEQLAHPGTDDPVEGKYFTLTLEGKAAKVLWDYPDCAFLFDFRESPGKVSVWKPMGNGSLTMVREGLLETTKMEVKQ